MKEYGGYIEFEYYHGKPYHENALMLNTASHCVEYLIRAKNIRKLYLPYYMCGCIADVCRRMKVSVAYYHTDIRFQPCFEGALQENEWLYIVNYYGQISNEMICQYKEEFVRIIVDNVQAFFQRPVPGVDTTYSCRKYFGVSDGGYLYTDTFLAESLEEDFSYQRMGFLLGRMEKTANEFYADYVNNNDRFAAEPLKSMSKLTRNLLRGIDYERIQQVRTENFYYLHERFHNFNRLELKVPHGAFMYPLYIENGAKIRRKMNREKIYIPTLWPDVFGLCEENSLEYDMAMNILLLPVDQRYGCADMQYISETVKCLIE